MTHPAIVSAAHAAAPSANFKSPTGCRPAQLFGLWSMEPERFKKLYAQAMRVDLVALGAARKARKADAPDAPLPSQRPDIEDSEDEYDLDDDEQPYTVSNGIAQIAVTGPMSKYETSFQGMFGGTSTLKTRRALRLADADPMVNGIMLQVDSPGGTVDGTADLGDTIAALAKPCYAYIADTGCSAAYWAASQADRVYCNRTAEVGCIGVVMRLEDTSKAYEQAGIKVHVISSGGMKGAGTDGAPVTDDQIAYFEQIASDTNDQFISAVAAGRKMTDSQARALADGRVHVGGKAQTLGLVDQVASYDDAMKALYLTSLKMSNPTEAFKAEHPDAYQAMEKSFRQAGKDDGRMEGRTEEIERMKALSAAFADRPGFAVEQFVAGHDLGKAKAALADVLLAENAGLKQAAAAAAAEKQKAAQLAADAHPQTPGFTGVPNLPTQPAGGRDAKGEFNRRVAEYGKTMKRNDAVNKVASEYPELYQQFLDSANVSR